MTEPRKSRLAAAPELFADPPIPDKLYFRIGEVSKLTETKAYVLRYWETEFPSLRPVRRSGHRLYRRRDVETIFRIKRLLYQQGFTIQGARRHILDSKRKVEQKPLFSNGAAASRGKAMQTIKRELEGILTILSRQC